MPSSYAGLLIESFDRCFLGGDWASWPLRGSPIGLKGTFLIFIGKAIVLMIFDKGLGLRGLGGLPC